MRTTARLTGPDLALSCPAAAPPVAWRGPASGVFSAQGPALLHNGSPIATFASEGQATAALAAVARALACKGALSRRPWLLACGAQARVGALQAEIAARRGQGTP